jgi:hypothetical protein
MAMHVGALHNLVVSFPNKSFLPQQTFVQHGSQFLKELLAQKI